MFDWLKKEKRQYYRIDLTHDTSFAIGLSRGETQPPIPGIPLNISAGGCAAVFPTDISYLLEEENTVELKISFAMSEKVLPVKAQVLETETDLDRLHCRFQFLDVETVRPFLEASQLDFLNRRQCYRADLATEASIPVTIGLGRNAPVGRIRDLSLTGMALVVAHEVAATLDDLTELRLSFTLPEVSQSLSLRGEIVFKRPDGDLFLYGVKFLKNPLDTGHKDEHKISSFIVKHQQKLLQIRAHLKG